MTKKKTTEPTVVTAPITWRNERRPAGKITPWARNPRRITERQMQVLQKSLKRFGYAAPLVLNADGQLIAGHMRLKAMQLLGEWQADTPVDVRVPSRPLTELEARDLAVLDNRAGGSWDWDVLANDFDQAELLDLGFEQVEIDGALNAARTGTEGKTDPDAIPEPPKVAKSKPGDLYLLGQHRLLCGDSTKAADVQRLLGTERAGLMNTDPPYGIAYDNTDRPGVAKKSKTAAVQNDDLLDAKLQAFLESVFKPAVSFALQPKAAWYLWHAHLTQGFFAAAAAAAAANVVLSRQIIWVKPVLLLTRGQYHWKHEPCFFGWVKGQQPPDYGLGNGERTQTTVWEVDGVPQAERKEWNHSTPKPVELFEIPIVKHLKPGEVCYEPFAGTGPQFIAAEIHGRRCFGIELEPLFVDVIVKRWEQFTGLKATLEPATGKKQVAKKLTVK